MHLYMGGKLSICDGKGSVAFCLHSVDINTSGQTMSTCCISHFASVTLHQSLCISHCASVTLHQSVTLFVVPSLLSYSLSILSRILLFSSWLRRLLQALCPLLAWGLRLPPAKNKGLASLKGALSLGGDGFIFVNP